MGYRSEVRIITTNKGYDELKKYTEKYLKDKDFKYDNLLDNCDLFVEDSNSKYFGWNAIKWYENIGNYEDVDAIMEGLEHLKEMDMSYRFARIGESPDDYEETSYESNTEPEKLNYPSMIREFDDEYIIHQMNSVKNKNDMEV